MLFAPIVTETVWIENIVAVETVGGGATSVTVMDVGGNRPSGTLVLTWGICIWWADPQHFSREGGGVEAFFREFYCVNLKKFRFSGGGGEGERGVRTAPLDPSMYITCMSGAINFTFLKQFYTYFSIKQQKVHHLW